MGWRGSAQCFAIPVLTWFTPGSQTEMPRINLLSFDLMYSWDARMLRDDVYVGYHDQTHVRVCTILVKKDKGS